MSQIELQKLARQFADGRITKQQYMHAYALLVQKTSTAKGLSTHVITNPQYRHVGHKRSPSPGFLAHLGYVIRNYHKPVLALLGTIGIFSSIYFNNFYHDGTSPQSRVVVLKKLDGSEAADRLRTEDIKLIVQLLIEDNNWNKDLVDDFIAQWSKLSKREKLNVKKSKWYRRFTLKLSTEISRQKRKVNKNSVAYIQKQQTLITLADTLVLKDILETKTSKHSAGKLTSQQPSVKQTNAAAGFSQPRTSSNAQSPLTKSTISDTSPQNKAVVRKIDSEQIVNLLGKFSVLFKAGRLDDLLALFSDHKSRNNLLLIDNLKQEYQTIFETTQQREVVISSIDWLHGNNTSKGRGNYRATMQMRDSQDNLTINATINISLLRNNNQIRITDFELFNKEILTEHANSNMNTSNKKNKANRRIYPTHSELQDLVTQYVDAYEQGDINKLMTLFASSSWTTDESGLTELQMEYNELFSNTVERELFIDNVDWSMKDGKAVGTGELVVTHHPDDEGNIITSQGKIRIITEKTENQVRITHLFHITN